MKNSSVFQNILNTLLRNLTISSYESSSCPSSSNGSSDSSPKGSRFGTGVDYWKFDDLSFLSIDLFEYLIKSMISLHIDQTRICSLIFHYQKSKFFSSYSPLQKCKVSETNINLLSLLSGSAFSGRALLDAFGMSLILNMRAIERSKLEYFLGSRLDEFTINDLLVRGKNMAAFDKVGFLIDLFMLEVAADPLLKCSKFYALAMTLPDFARESHDRLCHAIEIYLEVHGGLSEEQSAKLWSVLDLNKLSMVRTRLNLTRNGNTRLLPFVKQNRFKGRINNDSRVHGKQRSKVPQDTPNFKPKKSRTLDPCNAKSLPRLCR
ncbi:putative NPH3 domain-containing protein [Helianthus annuus]|nr:putative NPH3 domain-containing protein [Helianthus annuus]